MGFHYENQRVNFDLIHRKYLEYLALYATINNGSLAGATPFEKFYWRMTYYSRYQDRRTFSGVL